MIVNCFLRLRHSFYITFTLLLKQNTMKKLFYLLFVAAIFASCGNNNYTIKGVITNASVPPTVFLNLMHKNGAIAPIDSTSIAKGEFTMFGKVKKIEVGFLQFSGEATFPIILEKGNIKVKIDYKNWDDFEVTGTPLNEKLNAFHAKYRSLWVIADSAYIKFTRAEADNVLPKNVQDSLQQNVLVKYGEMLNYAKSFVVENNTTMVSVAALWFVRKGLKVEDYKKLSNQISDDLKYSPLFRMMQKQANGQLP